MKRTLQKTTTEASKECVQTVTPNRVTHPGLQNCRRVFLRPEQVQAARATEACFAGALRVSRRHFLEPKGITRELIAKTPQNSDGNHSGYCSF